MQDPNPIRMFSIAAHGQTVVWAMNYTPEGRAWADFTKAELAAARDHLLSILARYGEEGHTEADDYVIGQVCNGTLLTRLGDGLRASRDLMANVLPSRETAHTYLGLPDVKKLAICMTDALGETVAVRKRVRVTASAPGAPTARKRKRHAQSS